MQALPLLHSKPRASKNAIEVYSFPCRAGASPIFLDIPGVFPVKVSFGEYRHTASLGYGHETVVKRGLQS
jgi:hypothetical protein